MVSVLSRAIHVIFILGATNYLLRNISQAEYSLLPVVMAVVAFLPLFTGFLTAGIGRYLNEAHAQGDQEGVTEIVSSIIPVLLIAAFIVAGVGGTFAWHVQHLLDVPADRETDARLMMALLVFAMAIQLPLNPLQQGWYIRQNFVLFECVQFGRELLRLTLLCLMLLAFQPRVLWVVVATVTANVLAVFVLVGLSRPLVPSLRFRLDSIRWQRVPGLLQFGFWTLLGGMARKIREAGFPIMLNKLASPMDVNYFFLGGLPARHLSDAGVTAVRPLVPALTVLHAQRECEQMSNAFLRGGRYIMWMILFFVVPLMFFPGEAFRLVLGPKTEGAAPVMVFSLITLAVMCGNSILGPLAHASAQVRRMTVRQLLVQCSVLALSFYILKYHKQEIDRMFGPGGAAIACSMVMSTVATLGQLTLFWPLGWRLAEVSPKRWLAETLIPGFTPSIVTAGIYAICKTCLPESWLTLLIAAALGLPVYVASLWWFALNHGEKEEIRSVVREGLDRYRKNRPLFRASNP